MFECSIMHNNNNSPWGAKRMMVPYVRILVNPSLALWIVGYSLVEVLGIYRSRSTFCFHISVMVLITETIILQYEVE